MTFKEKVLSSIEGGNKLTIATVTLVTFILVALDIAATLSVVFLWVFVIVLAVGGHNTLGMLTDYSYGFLIMGLGWCMLEWLGASAKRLYGWYKAFNREG